MLEPIVRAFTDWFSSSESTGVNQQLPKVLMDSGNAPLKDIKSFWDETRSSALSKEALPEDPAVYPALIFRIQNADQMDGQTVHTWEQGVYELVVEYVTREMDPVKARSMGYNTLRAVLLSLRHFNRTEANSAPRVRNGVHINQCERMRYVPTFAELNGAWQAGAIVTTVEASDSLLKAS